MKTSVKLRCPRCGMTNIVPIRAVLIANVSVQDRIRFDCDDCGPVTRPVAFVAVLALLDAGMPPSITDEDVIRFQIGMAQIDDLAGIAELEGAS